MGQLASLLRRYEIRVEGWTPTTKNNNITGKELMKELYANPSRIGFPAEDSRERRRFIEQMIDCERVYTGDSLKLMHPNRRDAHDDYVKV